MALTESNIQRRSADELAFKLRLERPLIIKFRRLFRDIGRDLAIVYGATGQVQSANVYRSEVEGLLKPIYRQAGRKVGSLTRDNIKSVFVDWETKQEPAVDREVIDFVNGQPVIRARHITGTNQTELGGAVMSVVIAAGLAGETLNNEEIGKRAAKVFTEKQMHRADVIAMTEVQNAVEGSKFVELSALVALGVTVGAVSLTTAVEREWVAVLDTKTRASHVVADGQRRGLRPFDVGVDKLNFPGDTSLGASLANIINCRCGAHSIVNGSPSAEQIDSRVR